MELKLNSVKGWVGTIMTIGCVATTQTAMADVIDRPFFRADSIVIVFGADDFSGEGGEAPVVFDFLLLDNVPSGTAATDLIAADGHSVNFPGTYLPIDSGEGAGWEFQISGQTSGGAFNSAGPHQTLDANDSYTAFGLDENTDMDLLGNGNRAARFFVASNAPFDIFGEADNLQTSGDFSSLDYGNINYRFRVQVSGGGGANRWGAMAQNPATGGAGVVLGQTNNGYTLDDLTGGTVKVFDGGRKTAAQRGSIMQQAVSFQSRYRLRGASINGNNYDFSQGIGSISADVTYTIYTP